MTRPHPALLDLVVGRPLTALVDADVVRSASEHRVAGLLKTAVDNATPATPEAVSLLDSLDVATWARNRLLAAAVVEIGGIADALGIDVAFMKGVVSETRWYSRRGERPTWDIDLVISPWHRERAGDLVEALQPTHSILPFLQSILKRDRLQSIDLGYKGLPVDLHLDPLKLEVADSRFPERLWERVDRVSLDEGTAPVFDATVSLLLTTLALNKDRFRYLLGHSDLLRIQHDSGVDFARCERLATAEGVLGPVTATLAAVEADLGLTTGHARASSTHPVWALIWGPKVRLLGEEGKIRFRYRQSLIPMFDLRRWPEVAVAWARRILPSRALLDRTYPEVRGPYLTRVIVGRVRRRLDRWRQRRAVRPAP